MEDDDCGVALTAHHPSQRTKSVVTSPHLHLKVSKYRLLVIVMMADNKSSYLFFLTRVTSKDEVVPETQATTNVGPSMQPKQRRRHRKKQVGDTEPAVGGSSRLEKWSTEEEFQLTKAWIDVSEDPIVGPDFWSKIRSQFFQAMGREEYLTNDMISSKWRDMNQKVRRFNGIYSQKWQTRRSGQSDVMIELESEDQYQEEFNAPLHA
ncbi:hypothetical protein R6Q57_022083 [Mikania cordata]